MAGKFGATHTFASTEEALEPITEAAVDGLADTFNLHPIAGTPLTVNGFAPTTLPGDVLNLDLSGATGVTQLIEGPGNGSFTFSNRKPVTYNSIESLSPTALSR